MHFNLSRWALEHRTLVLFFMLLLGAAGTWSYLKLGRAEDPPFTIKVMVISTQWPGATAREVELQVTDKIEKKLQEVPYYDYVQSYSRPGESVVKIVLQDTTPPKSVPDSWYQVRKKIGDIRGTLPQGVIGPFFNDEFGDVYGTIYAFHGDGFSPAELKQIVEDVRQRLLSVKHVGKVDLIGAQKEKVWVEFSHKKLAAMGLTAQQVFDVLQRQNAMVSAGLVETPTARIPLRIEGDVSRVAMIAALPIAIDGKTIALGDVAEIKRGYEDPPSFLMRHNGKPVLGLAVSMRADGNNLELGAALAAEMDKIKAALPVGIEVEKVADQPKVVEQSISTFAKALAEALGIVLLVSFLSLGFRTGIVVALSVPLVLAITFMVMDMAGINLHRISLGALIIALGLLVDDAIIAVEMMVVKLEEGLDRIKAASFAYTSTAFPMLTGTLVTAVGFVPVGFAKSAAGEYTNAIFWVVAISLIVSWIVAVVFTPYLGYQLLPDFAKKRQARQDAHGGRGAHAGHGVHDGRIYQVIRSVVTWCVTWRKTVIAATVLAFAASIVGFRFIPNQFFPSSSRPELMVDMRLAEGSSIQATLAAAQRLDKLLADDPGVEQFATYVGGNSPRFYLPMNPDNPMPHFAQVVVKTKGLDEREGVLARLRHLFENDFVELRGRVTRLENGPPVGYPVQFRVVGKEPQEIRRIAEEVRGVMRANPDTRNVNLEWNELAKAVSLDIDHAKARALGVNPQDLATTLNTILTGVTVTQYREGTELIDVVARAVPQERLKLGDLASINIRTGNGANVPLDQIARIRYELEEPILWRRGRETMMSVRADIRDGVQAPTVSAAIDKDLASLRATLPDGYRIDIGGSSEESRKSQASINAMMPVMLLLMLFFLMVQLQSFQRLFMVLLSAPLGLIGVSAALLLFQQPIGFVAMLGIIALAGMIMRNSVILVDQIDTDIRSGESAWDAVIGATVRRARPIALTAAAAILAMVPLSRDVFWGPMAVAIMGGLAVATLLTLLFLPALYAAWFRVQRPAAIADTSEAAPFAPGLVPAE
ncbi:efflux RND transporter permease subunit [Desertibaculum subflavum]|uniref:efflux RND transporter permease subunit n=1 Tax=Desertibaculum subflavum TaxID=2268458 RepID=UPI000E6753A2